MRMLRSTVIGVVLVMVSLLAPGVAAADGGTIAPSCDRVWIWWIPFPCPSD
jgi:hypothetical protein